jgi:hypothetical protein
MKKGSDIVITVSEEEFHCRIKLCDASKRIPLLPMFKGKKQILMCRTLLEDGKPDPKSFFYVTNWNLFQGEAYLVPETMIKLSVIEQDRTDEDLKDFVESLKQKSQSYKIRAVLLHKQWDEYGEKMQKAYSVDELIQIMNAPELKTGSLKEYVDEIVVLRNQRYEEKQKNFNKK